jgi:hypothetical protein
MWIKYEGHLYNTDKCYAMLPSCKPGFYPSFILRYDAEPLYDEQGNINDKANYVALGDMTAKEAKTTFKLVCAALKDGCTVLDLDRRLPVETKRIQEADEADGDSYKEGC